MTISLSYFLIEVQLTSDTPEYLPRPIRIVLHFLVVLILNLLQCRSQANLLSSEHYFDVDVDACAIEFLDTS